MSGTRSSAERELDSDPVLAGAETALGGSNSVLVISLSFPGIGFIAALTVRVRVGRGYAVWRR